MPNENIVSCETKDDTLYIRLNGRVDASCCSAVQAVTDEALTGVSPEKIVIDAAALDYISSAGLRIILGIKKKTDSLRIVNVNSEVYGIFDMTGFTEILEVEAAMRQVSVEGCRLIGEGANGKVYRIAPDTVVKVFSEKVQLSDIKRERELARTAFVLGIPTAIPYDTVKVGERYGSVFELLDTRSMAQLIADDPSRLEELITQSVDLMKKIHSTKAKNAELPDPKAEILREAKLILPALLPETGEKLMELLGAIPESGGLIHGDFQIKNIMVQNGELLLIDMDTLCSGDPIFEFAGIYNCYCGYTELDRENSRMFLNISYELAIRIWELTLDRYFGGDPEKIRKAADCARVIGSIKLIKRSLGSKEARMKPIARRCAEHINSLVPRLDSLSIVQL